MCSSDLTLTVSNVFDLAGNRAAGEPFVTVFDTLDTLGPDLGALRITGNRPPVAGSLLSIEATLVKPEPGVVVRFTQDFAPAGFRSNAPYSVPIRMPASGSTTVRAIASDRFGNDGPIIEKTFAVVSNQAPVATLKRLSPAPGPLANGETFTLQLGATDDLSVTNLTLIGLGAIPFATNYASGLTRTNAFEIGRAHV